MTQRWVPPNLNAEEVQDFLTIKAGIPDTARPSLVRVIFSSKSESSFIGTGLLSRFELAYGKKLFTDYGQLEKASRLWGSLESVPEADFTALVDFFLHGNYYNDNYVPDSVARIGRILDTAGAGWSVGERAGSWSLLRRTPEGVEHIVDQIISNDERSSSLLKRAWDNAYGPSPEPSFAYSLAVKAVESVAIPAMDMKGTKVTLGQVIGQFKNPGKNWSFVLPGADDQESIAQLRETMNFLWGSQHDRHAGPSDYKEVYKDVSLEEAQAAILLASTLVGWFSLEFFSRRKSD